MGCCNPIYFHNFFYIIYYIVYSYTYYVMYHSLSLSLYVYVYIYIHPYVLYKWVLDGIILFFCVAQPADAVVDVQRPW